MASTSETYNLEAGSLDLGLDDTSEYPTNAEIYMDIETTETEEADAGSLTEAAEASDKAAITDIYVDDWPNVDQHLTVDELLSMWNLTKLIRELGNHSQCVAFAEAQELVAKERKCGSHRSPMTLSAFTNKSFGSWVCRKRTCRDKTRVARAKGTFFENVKIDLVHVFYLIYAFAHKWSYDTVIREDPWKEEKQKCLSQASISDWYSQFREVVVIYQIENTEPKAKVGGPGKIVQINECKFSKKKCNRVRNIEGQWILGMIEEGSEDLRLEICSEDIRSADVLMPLIKKHIQPGTTIHTDYWTPYNCLGEHGFVHKKINISDPDSPTIQPKKKEKTKNEKQSSEPQWRGVKKFFKRGNPPENFSDALVEYLWRRNIQQYKKDPFVETLRAIKYVY